MRAVRLESVGHLFLRQVEDPVPGPDDLLVRIEASGICDTDRHLLHGDFPSKPPVTLGHEFCGIVEAMGSGVQGFRTGMRVTGDPNIVCGRCEQCHAGRINLCRNLTAIGIHRDGGLADYVLVPQKQAHELPLSLEAAHGAFCEPLACCLHGIDIAGIEAGSSVVVLGGGVIGLLTVQLARLAGARRVVLSTRQASRRRLAEAVGATASVDPTAGDIVARVTGPGGLLPGGADVVIECAGVGETVEQAFQLARPGGTVVILGRIGDNFGAGFTGGMAFVYDPDAQFAHRANPESLTWQRLGSAHWDSALRDLVSRHVAETNSRYAARLLHDWPAASAQFWQVVPKEFVKYLPAALSDEDIAVRA